MDSLIIEGLFPLDDLDRPPANHTILLYPSAKSSSHSEKINTFSENSINSSQIIRLDEDMIRSIRVLCAPVTT